MYESALSVSPRLSPSETSTIADIERKLFGSCFGEQSPGLLAARRRYLELNELLEAGEKHGDSATKKEILVGWARTLELATDVGCKPGLLNVDMDKIGGRPVSRADRSPDSTKVQLHLEAKHTQVSGIPGMHNSSELLDSASVAREQCKLLSTHAQYISELVAEAELLESLCRHTKEHPVYEAARGLESYFGGLIDSLCLKLRITAADMHQTLYSPSTTKALKNLYARLKEKETALMRERSALDERLAIYRDAGSEFQDIASSYAAILKECDQVREDIERISEL
ncbi:hypothetical protein IWW48_001696 [Coemansia sp. RSA 1200]|nr:hypothetical protein IWW48_001696 [Coemansia sp. RSA 1200]